MPASPAIEGFLLGFSLILAIGAQNAFVLRQGLIRQHVLAIVLVCALSDAILIAAGVAGFGRIIDDFAWLPPLMAGAGAIFLCVYGALRLKAAWRPQAMTLQNAKAPSLGRAIAACLAFTWLNPHVYLDTVILLGGISARHAGIAKLAFGLGASLSSFVFFFSLGYGARLLAPLFAKPGTWRLLDGLIALTMFAIAASLLASFF